MVSKLRIGMAWLCGVLAAGVCTVTVVSTIRSNQGWIRVLDFPRLLELAAIGVVAVGCAVFLRRLRRLALAALLLSACWQIWRIYPYIAGTGTEVVQAEEIADIDPRSCFKVLGLNVLQSNRNHSAVAAALEREQPDVLLLMETDAQWERALATVLQSYPYRLSRPIANRYGMVFATKLAVRSARMVDITDRDTPTVYAALSTRNGRVFDYVGLHPRPPLPGQDTRRRDAKIEHAALAISQDRMRPAVAMGDFNDVAWSRTTQLFKKAGGFIDPRVGRGSYPTFPASISDFGWPLDQLFVTPEFTFRSVRVLENVGSDHRPLAAELCLLAERPSRNVAVRNRDDAREDARSTAREIP